MVLTREYSAVRHLVSMLAARATGAYQTAAEHHARPVAPAAAPSAASAPTQFVARSAHGGSISVATAAEAAPNRQIWMLIGLFATPFIVWAIFNIVVHPVQFSIDAPRAQIGIESAAVGGWLFAAFALLLLPTERLGDRLRWVAAGLSMMALSMLSLSYLTPHLLPAVSINMLAYAGLANRATVTALCAFAFVPARAPRFSRRMLLPVLAVFGLLLAGVLGLAEHLPPLVQPATLSDPGPPSDVAPGNLTAWHQLLSTLVLGLAVAAVLGAARHTRNGTVGGWLLLALCAQAALQLNNLFWPPVLRPVLNLGDLLRLLSAVSVAMYAVLELRRLANERAMLLENAEEHARRLTDLARLKADFTAMVAHELGNPVAAIRGLSDMLATGSLTAAQQARALAAIQTETTLLATLIGDMQTAASVERDEFSVRMRPVELSRLVADAASFANTLPGKHPITVSGTADVCVQADYYRVGQVLRNLLSNAAKYTPAGTPIELHTEVAGERVRIEVRDQGPGIAPRDLKRIFEKFGRGGEEGGLVPGLGLGLYLSRGIARAHGSDLDVQSTVGSGSVFAFGLEVAP